MLNYLKRFWLMITSISIVLLLFLQIGFSIYRTNQAEEFVSSIFGTYYDKEGIIFYDDIERDVHADLYVVWDYTDKSPPTCPVTLIGRFEHESSLAVIDFPIDEISAEQFKAIHKTKNGHISVEPIYSLDSANIIRTHPGKWRYTIVFKFHCSIVNSDWLAFLKFDEAFETKPVLFEVE